MRYVLLLLALLAPSAVAQTAPDTLVAERVRRPAPARSATPVAVRALGGALGGASGVYAGYHLGDSVDPDGFLVSDGALYGSLLGSALGSAVLVTATGDRDGFWRTLAGAAIGSVGGLALASVLPARVGGIEQALVLGVPVGSTAGAMLANAAFQE